jgi:hypothetical protein
MNQIYQQHKRAEEQKELKERSDKIITMNEKQKIIRGHFNCTCNEGYTSRDMVDPNCFLCENEGEIELIIDEYFQNSLEMRSKKMALLEQFALFLEKQGYMDTDWRTEEPYAIDEFIKDNK